MRRPSTAAFYARPHSRAKAIPVPAPTPPTDENTSPAKSPLTPNADLKEIRAWEHDRQRLKKAAGLVKSKARKTQWAQTRAQGGWVAGRLYTPPRPHAVDDSGTDEPACEESEVDWDDASSPVRSRSPPAEREWEGVLPHAPSRSEVPLTDLLISRKPRHGREPDFEVVPPVRSVIVLDDTATPDLDFNDPWEHVDLDDATEHHHQHEREPSYAKIASLN